MTSVSDEVAKNLMSSADSSASISNDLHENAITNSMLAEEENLQHKGEEDTKTTKQQAIEQWCELSEDVRITQLNHLLEKSSVYANFLVSVIEKTKARRARRKHVKTSKKCVESSETSKNSKDVMSLESRKKSCYATRKRKPETECHIPKKRKKKFHGTCSGDYAENCTLYKIQDIVHVCKNKQKKDFMRARILDMKHIKGEVFYYVHYIGLQTSDDDWIASSLIVADTSGSTDASTGALKHKKISLEEESLLNKKLHTGEENMEKMLFVNNARYFKGTRVPDSQPKLFTGGILREYQITGYEWLKVLFENGVNGILADEMGLGKTIQCIAMLCNLVTSGFHGPYLVCAPLSTISNWINELKRFAPQLPVLLYHGTAAERAVLRPCIADVHKTLSCHPVVVTSYEILMRDRSFLAKYSWDYLMVDEGHRLKNMNCRLLKELKMIQVTCKVLLTGTPLQNNLPELWSMLNFLLPEVFNDLSLFEAWFDLGKIQKTTEIFSSNKEKNVVGMLHKILAPFLLRRIKADVDINLPPKREMILFVPLAASQYQFYQAIASKSLQTLLKKGHSENDKENRGTCTSYETYNEGQNNCLERQTRSSTLQSRIIKEKKNFYQLESDAEVNVSLNNMLMHLRKCCNHPYLINYPLVPGTNIYKIDDELITSCGKMQLLDRMLPVLRKNGHKVLLFSQMTRLLDILEDYCSYKDFTYSRLDGSTKCDDRERNINKFNSDKNQFLFLLSTRAGGLGINLTAADTVIIYDSDWNPQNDLQAQDRCHRIGQDRPVIVYRFVSANTVDQYMVERAEAKRVLDCLILNRSKFKGKLAEDMTSTNSSDCSVSTTLLSMLQASANRRKCIQPISDNDLQKVLQRNIVMSCTNKDITCGVFQETCDKLENSSANNIRDKTAKPKCLKHARIRHMPSPKVSQERHLFCVLTNHSFTFGFTGTFAFSITKNIKNSKSQLL
ncbi:lymphocyte-specific helicase-like [Clavelina lepadiformis]|uniref:lymphocyte-specific helicase-like n=1 Tax=Clavelina lepadiformis TaxID=159417 RepID=UPI0040434FDC